MKLCLTVAIVLANILILRGAASSRVARQSSDECDIDNVAMLASGVDQSCLEANSDATKNDVFCQPSCSTQLIAAYEKECSGCEFRETAARRCYRLNSTYSCMQLDDDKFITISLQELTASSNCFGENINATVCKNALTNLVTIMGCCFNAIYNTSLYDNKGTLGLATFELWETYDLPALPENCLTPSFETTCPGSNDITSSPTSGEQGLRQILPLASVIMLLLATIMMIE